MTDYEMDLLVEKITRAVVEAMRSPLPALLKAPAPSPEVASPHTTVFDYQREKRKPVRPRKFRG